MKPDQLFLGALPALMQGDDSSARVLIKQASDVSASVAEKYYEKDTPMHSTLAGQAHLYLALFSYFRAGIDLSILDLEKLAAQDLTENAMEAERLLAKGDLTNAQVRAAYQISKCLVEASKLQKGIAGRMQLCLEAAFKPDSQGFRDLRATASRAIDHASKGGPLFLPFIRTLNRDEERLKNLGPPPGR